MLVVFREGDWGWVHWGAEGGGGGKRSIKQKGVFFTREVTLVVI